MQNPSVKFALPEANFIFSRGTKTLKNRSLEYKISNISWGRTLGHHLLVREVGGGDMEFI